jgi:DNA topoisomerase IB
LAPGIARVRHGRGFTYRDPAGRRIGDQTTLERLRGLAIPPAWTDVWICLDELGHLQATGTDAAGRKQYLYHPLWSERRDRAKFERMLAFAESQPRLRRRVTRDLRDADPTRTRVLAGAVRLLDLGLFRVGSEEYAETNGSFGLTTLRKEHLTITGDALRFDYPAKSGLERIQIVNDRRCAELLQTLKRRRSGGSELLAYRDGHRWFQLHAEDVNEYLKAVLGGEYSAKDFRTWNATVIAATALAATAKSSGVIPTRGTKTGRERAIRSAVTFVAEALGNTPAVARRSYIDPRVFDRYRAGNVVELDVDPDLLVSGRDAHRRRIERAVLELLTG